MKHKQMSEYHKQLLNYLKSKPVNSGNLTHIAVKEYLKSVGVL